ncbi:hypothetical protein ACFLQN_04315 [Candidatus Aenigmatarchaeota archaeon]
MEINRAGELAFLVFVVVAILAGIAAAFAGPLDTTIVSAVLVVLGIIVGFLNISEKETTAFLIAAVALLVAGTASFNALGSTPGTVGYLISQILGFIGAFVAPAAVIVALKAVYALGRKK